MNNARIKMLDIRLQTTIHMQNQSIITVTGVVWNTIRIRSRQEWSVIAGALTHTHLI